MTPLEYQCLISFSSCLPIGDIVIGGTWDGSDVRAIWDGDPSRNIIVVDSFEGLAEPTENDLDTDDFMKEKECNIDGGKETYINTFTNLGLLPPKEIYEMWISKEKLSKIKKRPIALLFLDLDHYQPTKDCLEYFSSWIIPGGMILVHDYDFERCPGIKKCCDEFSTRWKKIPNTGFARLGVE